MLDALRNVRTRVTVVVSESKSHALDFLDRSGEFADRLTPDPDLIVVDATNPDGVDDFVRCARSMNASKPCPILALTPAVPQETLHRWYLAGVHSVLSSESEQLTESLESISWYWLKHNSTPKLR